MIKLLLQNLIYIQLDKTEQFTNKISRLCNEGSPMNSVTFLNNKIK